MELSVNTFITLDGVMQAPGGPHEDPSNGFERGGWLVPHSSDNWGSVVDGWFRRADALLLGAEHLRDDAHLLVAGRPERQCRCHRPECRAEIRRQHDAVRQRRRLGAHHGAARRRRRAGAAAQGAAGRRASGAPTLVQASLAAYERFVEVLSPEEEERYYQEMALVARIFGTPASVIPGSLDEFREYFRVEVESGAICVTRPAREVVAVILEAPLPAPLRLFAPAHRLSSAGLLPPKLREDYGLRWTPLHELALPLAACTLHLSAAPLLRMASKLAPPARTLAA
jgi:hypothetical protein